MGYGQCVLRRRWPLAQGGIQKMPVCACWCCSRNGPPPRSLAIIRRHGRRDGAQNMRGGEGRHASRGTQLPRLLIRREGEGRVAGAWESEILLEQIEDRGWHTRANAQ